MTPEAFVAKWSQTTTKERAASQEHFIDLCRVLGEKTPNEADPSGEWYAFEKGVEKTGAGRGWADVWKRGHFGWEYKSKSGGRTSTLAGALRQLQQYALALESPPLLIVSDIDTIEIHTAFQNAVEDVHIINLGEFVDPSKLDLIRSALKDPERLRPQRTRDQVTAEAAGQFAQLAFALRADGHDPQVVAHFLNKILFCMFAEDVGILKTRLFTEIAEKAVERPEHFNTFIQRLFQAMQVGGPFGTEIVDWFNGGLFDDDVTLPLSLSQIRTVRDLSRMDWSQIEPAIFGTLFERGLDPDKRSQLGAHYTDPEKIMRLVEPTIVEPLLTEWKSVRSEIASQMERLEKVKSKSATEKRRQAANHAFQGFQERLRNFRVLDPACGSGNFLYLSLQALKNIEHRANIEAEALGLQKQAPLVGPECVYGIEINAYAAELARVTIWIGEIQWMLNHGYSLSKNPILKPLNTIEQRDAVLNADGTEPEWPSANVIVGNPPFLGAKMMNRRLGKEYTAQLRKAYEGRLKGFSDLVCYWFERARTAMLKGQVERVGLVATSSIRGGTNRPVIDAISNSCRLYNAWSELPWMLEGARVEVSLICFEQSCAPKRQNLFLDSHPVQSINPDLTTGIDLTRARPINANRGVSFLGIQTSGPLDISGHFARELLLKQGNPNGQTNSSILKPYWNGDDLAGRPRDRWLIDFPLGLTESQASEYEAPFTYLESAKYNPDDPKDLRTLREARSKARDKHARERWWEPYWPRPEMRELIANLPRYIVTAETAQYRIFVWLSMPTLPDKNLIVISRDDDCTFGVLQSKYHELWSLRLGTSLEDRPRYTSTTTFATFPFPDGLTPDVAAVEYQGQPRAKRIAEAASRLNMLRQNWLNPPELVEFVSEVVPGYPDRPVAKDPDSEKEIKRRTLTNLYKARPAWLVNAHRKLDAAVASAYGFPDDLDDDQILANLLELNLERVAQA